jgi:hypothetical protein
MVIKRALPWLAIISAVLTLLGLSWARAEDGKLTMFQGGAYRSDMLLSNGLLFGVGSKTSSLGGTCTGLQYGVENLYWNPARLGFLPNSQAMLDITPPLPVLNFNAFLDLNQAAAEEVDDLIAKMGSEDLILSHEDYPQIEAAVSQKGWVHNAALALPLRGWGIGLGFYQPLHMGLNMVGTGLQVRASDESEDDPLNRVTVSASADLSLLLDIEVNAVSFGIGKEILPRWTLGLGIDRFYGYSATNGRLQLEGIILQAVRETAFNDPSGPWPNQLHSEMVGSYHGATWAAKLGTSYRLRPNVSLDGIVILPTTLRLKGHMDIVQYSMPVGIDFDSENPVDADKVDPYEPTRTELEDNPTADQIVIHIPGTFKLGAAWRVKFLTAILQYGHYFGDLSCLYGIEKMEPSVEYTLGMKPDDVLTLGMDFKLIRFSGGLILGRSMYRRDPEKEDDHSEEKRLLVPTFSLGTGFGLGERYGVDLLLISIPTGLMRVTTTCNF